MAKGKKGKKGGRKKASQIVDGLSPNEMSPAQLLGHIKRLQTEIDREREERNFFMLEREKLFTLWNLSVEQLAEEKQKSRLIDVQNEQTKKDAKNEMDLYKQKLRFLQAEQSKKLGLVRLNHLEKMRKLQDELWAIQMLMKESLTAKKRQLRNAQVSIFELLRRMHMEHADKTSTMRKQFANEIRRIEMMMDRQLERDREVLERESTQEMTKLVQVKEDQLAKMMAGHEKQVLEMKTFFNDLAVNNFAVITSLQHDIVNKKIEEQRSRRELEQSKAKYYALLGPIKEMEKQMAEWSEQEVDMKEVQAELKKVNAQIESNRRYTRMMECAHEALNQRMALMQEEGDAYKKEFVKELLVLQKRASMQRLVSQMKINALKNENEYCKKMMGTQGQGSSVVYVGEFAGEGEEDEGSGNATQAQAPRQTVAEMCQAQAALGHLKHELGNEAIRNLSKAAASSALNLPGTSAGYGMLKPGAQLTTKKGKGARIPRSWSSQSSQCSKASVAASLASVRSVKSASSPKADLADASCPIPSRIESSHDLQRPCETGNY